MSKKGELMIDLRERLIDERDFHSHTEGCSRDNKDCSVMTGYQSMINMIDEILEIEAREIEDKEANDILQEQNSNYYNDVAGSLVK